MLFKIMGHWLRGLIAMGFGGLWLGMAYYLSGFGQFAPTPTVVGLLVIGGIAFASGLFIFIKGIMFATQKAPLPKDSTVWRDDGQRSASDFDADAIIARCLAQMEADKAMAAEPTPDVPPRPTFGRKQV